MTSQVSSSPSTARWKFEVVEGVVRVVVGSIPLGDDVVDVREGHRRRRRVEGRGVAGDRRGRQ